MSLIVVKVAKIAARAIFTFVVLDLTSAGLRKAINVIKERKALAK